MDLQPGISPYPNPLINQGIGFSATLPQPTASLSITLSARTILWKISYLGDGLIPLGKIIGVFCW